MILKILLPQIKAAIDALLGKVEAQVPTFTADELNVLENILATQFHIPASVMAFLKGENATITAVVDPIEIAALEFLKARIDGLAL